MLLNPHIVLVLVEPRDTVNVGGVIRVMLNFGLQRLRLVRPASGVVDPARLDDVAHRSGDIVRDLQVVDTLAEALTNVTFAVATTARPRAMPGPVATPRAAAPTLLQQAVGGQLALVFGSENLGLCNADLDLCHLVLTIPTAPVYRSLNLAQAALLVCYELWLASQAESPDDAYPHPGTRLPDPGDIPAPVDQLEGLFAETAGALHAIGFLRPGQEAVILRRLRSILHRAWPTVDEVTLLRAMAREVNKYVERESS